MISNIKFNTTTEMVDDIDRVVSSLGVSRSHFIRLAIKSTVIDDINGIDNYTYGVKSTLDVVVDGAMFCYIEDSAINKRMTKDKWFACVISNKLNQKFDINQSSWMDL